MSSHMEELLKKEMSSWSSCENSSRSWSSVLVAMMAATMEPTLEPASTRGSSRCSNSALTTPCGRTRGACRASMPGSSWTR
jgi:hypothetical protein